MSDFPNVIYLQRETEDEDFCDETTWCADKINDADVVYRKIDLSQTNKIDWTIMQQAVGMDVLDIVTGIASSRLSPTEGAELILKYGEVCANYGAEKQMEVSP